MAASFEQAAGFGVDAGKGIAPLPVHRSKGLGHADPVGAGLPANRTGQRAFPHAKNRLQASPYKYKKTWPLVGAGLPANHAGQRALPHAKKRLLASAYKDNKPGPL